MTTIDPLHAPRLPDAEVTRLCREAAKAGTGAELPDVVAHAIVARRLPLLVDPDAADGTVGRFLRTGAVPNSPSSALWWRLYGPMYTTLPDGIAIQAAMLSDYLAAHCGRGEVDGWLCTDRELTPLPSRKD